MDGWMNWGVRYIAIVILIYPDISCRDHKGHGIMSVIARRNSVVTIVSLCARSI
jgi:hypothetical protein